jgi:hypothetical protein
MVGKMRIADRGLRIADRRMEKLGGARQEVRFTFKSNCKFKGGETVAKGWIRDRLV